LVAGRYYDTELTALLKAALHGRPRALVVDVGANIGWAALYAAAMGHDAVAFEAMPSTCARLRMGVLGL
jgi:hypothetical protein